MSDAALVRADSTQSVWMQENLSRRCCTPETSIVRNADQRMWCRVGFCRGLRLLFLCLDRAIGTGKTHQLKSTHEPTWKETNVCYITHPVILRPHWVQVPGVEAMGLPLHRFINRCCIILGQSEGNHTCVEDFVAVQGQESSVV